MVSLLNRPRFAECARSNGTYALLPGGHTVRNLVSRRRFLQVSSLLSAYTLTRSNVFAATGTLERIKSEREFRIGIDAGFPPFSFRDNSGQIIGYDHDLAMLFCKPLGAEPKLVDTQWSGVIPSLYAGRFDAIMGGISYTKARAEKVAFTIPYAEASQALLIRSGDKDKIKTPLDMSGRVIGVKLSSPAEIVVKTLEPKIQQARGKGLAAVKTYDDLSAAYLALLQGTVDAVMNSIATMSVVMRDKPGAFTIVKGVGADSWCAIALRKDDTDLLTFLNQELMRVRQNNQIYELQERWFQFKTALPDQLPNLNV
jgi:polar amino acid transport system substrate-binding protein